jgi:hypothetical protein
MADQFLTIATISENTPMNRRVAACYAQQTAGDVEPVDPTQWAFDRRYGWAAAPGWAEAWDSAVASGVDDPGADPAVITDAQILTQVQAMIGAGG